MDCQKQDVFTVSPSLGFRPTLTNRRVTGHSIATSSEPMMICLLNTLLDIHRE